MRQLLGRVFLTPIILRLICLKTSVSVGSNHASEHQAGHLRLNRPLRETIAVVLMNNGKAHTGDQVPQVGATQWDFALQLLRLFGVLAPSVIILVGAYYAVMAFRDSEKQNYEQLNQARSDAAKEFREQIKTVNDAMVTANEAVRKSSTAMAEQGNTQMQMLQKVMELQASATDRMAKTREDYEQSIEKLRQSRAELEQQLRDKEMLVAAEEEQKKAASAKLTALNEELANIATTRDVATKTLGTLGTLVDDAPDLLRAVATTEGVRNILAQSTTLLDGAVLAPGLQHDRVQIALAFADLEGFVGDPQRQRDLAMGVLGLLDNLRATRTLQESGLTNATIDADEAMARAFLGNAAREGQQFQEAIEQSKQSIALYDRALALEVQASPRRTKWLRRQAETYEQLGRAIDRHQHDREMAVGTLQHAVDIFEQLRSERPGHWLSVAGVGWAHFNIAEVERDHQTFDAASTQYALARNSIGEIADRARHSNDWLDRMSAVYNGSAILLFDQVSSELDAADGDEMLPARKAVLADSLNEALRYLKKAGQFSEELVQSDASNLAWLTLHGWSRHNLGAVELALGTIESSASGLNTSIATLGTALTLRKEISRRAPGQSDWVADWRWTQMYLNLAQARLARQQGNFAAMREVCDTNVKLIDEALRDDPDSDDWWWHRADSQLSAADASARLGQGEAARQVYAEVRSLGVARAKRTTLEAEKQRWTQLLKRVDRGLEGR